MLRIGPLISISDKFAGYCCVKDVLLTLTDCLESNSLTLVAIKKLFTPRALVDINIDVVNFDKALCVYT